MACDNLLCDGHGRPPNPTLVVDAYMPAQKTWVQYGRTEIIEVLQKFHCSSSMNDQVVSVAEKQQSSVSEHHQLQGFRWVDRRVPAQIHRF